MCLFMRLTAHISHLILCVSRYLIDTIVVGSCRCCACRGKEKMITLIIEGQLPNLNDYTDACRSHRQAGAQMKKKAENLISEYILKQLGDVNFKETVKLAFRWYEPNKKRDLDNVCFAKKFILDALVRNKIIVTDSWKGVIGFTDSFYIDKEHPRIEVDIEEA